MRKRAGLARTFALAPWIPLPDEPTVGLDPIGASEFDALIRSLNQALGLSVFLVTHDLERLHATCHRVAVLADRRVPVTGTGLWFLLWRAKVGINRACACCDILLASAKGLTRGSPVR
jgi:ABC-type transporter Mla maintaining outer membrane lipid asymmetry ATPase subunit MlaF